MSTRSIIGKINKDNTISIIYCHHDGYPEGVGKILEKYYTRDNIDQLLKLGSLSVLGATPISDKKYWDNFNFSSYKMRVNQDGDYLYCAAFKDRDNSTAKLRIYKEVNEIKNAYHLIVEYLYILNLDGVWEVYKL